jgi:hypothetical protein
MSQPLAASSICNVVLGASHNTADTDTHFVDRAMLNLRSKNSRVHSIAFAAKKIGLSIGGKSAGVVC